MKSFAEANNKEINAMIAACKHAAAKVAEHYDFGGLSNVGVFSVYIAVENAIYKEHTKAKAYRDLF